MTCDQSIELLPWYLNGTLESGERAEVRQHLETCEQCRAALAETGQAWSVFAQHIPIQDMVALAWGERPSGIDPALAEEHLASCLECAAELELARTSRREEEDEGKVVPFPAPTPPRTDRTYRGWRAAALAASLSAVVAGAGWLHSARLEERMAAPPPAGRPEATVAPSPAPAERPNSVQAELTKAQEETAQLQEKNTELERQVKQAQEERSAIPRDLLVSVAGEVVHPSEVLRSKDNDENSDSAVLVIPTNAALAVPLEAPTGAGAHTGREAVIVSSAGKAVTKPVVFNADTGRYTLLLSKDDGLKTGSYTIKIYGTAKDKREPELEGTYKIRISSSRSAAADHRPPPP